MPACPVTVIIPTYNRPDQLLVTLEHIYNCDPYPNEVIVHIDANDKGTQTALHNSSFQETRIIQSNVQVGPGGGRNIALAEASHELVASFDDDSYPLDKDYFRRLVQLFEEFSQAAVIGASIFHIGEQVVLDQPIARWVADFVGCGCAYRKSIFLQTNGYVPLALAYGMEEVDLALQLHNLNLPILQSPYLRVFHNTQLTHHSTPKVTAASIANLALLAILRYPASFWWLGVAQCLNRIFWLIKHGRYAGIFQGIITIPQLISQHHHRRKIISREALHSYLKLRNTEGSTLDIESTLPGSPQYFVKCNDTTLI